MSIYKVMGHAMKMSPDIRYDYLHQSCTATTWRWER